MIRVLVLGCILLYGCRRGTELESPATSVPIEHSPAPGATAPRCFACRDVHYARAVLVKPEHVQRQRRLFPLAPILVWGADSENANDASAARAHPDLPRFDTMCEREGRVDPREARNVIYRSRSMARLQDRSFPQIAYIWKATDHLHPDRGAPQWRGVRMTLDDAGVPIIWEVLDPVEPVAPIFVSEQLEEAAERQYGKIAAGGSYAVESVNGANLAAVAGLLADSAEPMGPFIYIDPQSGRIETILCRCMASMVDEITDTIQFELVDLEDQCALAINDLIAAGDSEIPAWWREAADPDWLQRALRLPNEH